MSVPQRRRQAMLLRKRIPICWTTATCAVDGRAAKARVRRQYRRAQMQIFPCDVTSKDAKSSAVIEARVHQQGDSLAAARAMAHRFGSHTEGKKWHACRMRLQAWLLHCGTAHGLVDTVGRCRELGELGGRATRAGYKLAAAVRATTAEHLARTQFAECAFERADAGFRGLRRQVAVAAFAVGSQLKHVDFSPG